MHHNYMNDKLHKIMTITRYRQNHWRIYGGHWAIAPKPAKSVWAIEKRKKKNMVRRLVKALVAVESLTPFMSVTVA